jgi:hypothetical protein
LQVSGFGTCVKNNTSIANSGSWGMIWNSYSFSACTTAYDNGNTGSESTTFNDGKFSGNGTAFTQISGNTSFWKGGSIDASVTAGVSATGGALSLQRRSLGELPVRMHDALPERLYVPSRYSGRRTLRR